ncbi:relA-associated inhibitor, partial [Tupaia chinensis]|uniref:relA-associated inhibitor n=1 Tax=Tupaia chinensis TaxID=246437 RepID=UPI000FFB920E
MRGIPPVGVKTSLGRGFWTPGTRETLGEEPPEPEPEEAPRCQELPRICRSSQYSDKVIWYLSPFYRQKLCQHAPARPAAYARTAKLSGWRNREVAGLAGMAATMGMRMEPRSRSPAPAGTMDSEAFQSARDLLDLNFQSLAMKHMDLKQMELDTAAAKVDELTKQLESLWSDSPTPGSQAGTLPRMSRFSSSPVHEPFSSRGSPRKAATDGADAPFGRSESAPTLLSYSPLPSSLGGPLLGAGGSAFAPPLRAQDDLTLRRRPPKAWNESDLDVAYEKKSSQTASYERLDVFTRPASPGLQLLPWRESSLDGLGATSKDNLTSATLPRNYKVSPLASDRRADVGSYRRSLGSAGPSGTLPRSWQPVSRIPMPPATPQPR